MKSGQEQNVEENHLNHIPNDTRIIHIMENSYCCMKSDTTMHSVLSNKGILEARNTKCNKHVNEIVIYWLITNESLASKSNN